MLECYNGIIILIAFCHKFWYRKTSQQNIISQNIKFSKLFFDSVYTEYHGISFHALLQKQMQHNSQKVLAGNRR